MEKKIYLTPLTEETPIQTWGGIMKTSIDPASGMAPRRRTVGDIID